MATTFEILAWSAFLFSQGIILVIELLLWSRVTRIIRHRPLIFNSSMFCIKHESRYIPIIKKNCRTTLFLHQAIKSHHKLVHLSPRFGYHAWGIHRELGELERILFHTHPTLTKVHEFDHLLLPQL